MKLSWKMPVAAAIFTLFYMGLANAAPSCLSSPQVVEWGSGGSTEAVLCGYNNGDADAGYIQINHIPKKTKNGCLTIQYQPLKSTDDDDVLLISPNEGVVVGGLRSPTTLDLPDTGSLVTGLPIKTDNVKDDEYGLSVSGQSSSVDVQVKIDWTHKPDCNAS